MKTSRQLASSQYYLLPARDSDGDRYIGLFLSKYPTVSGDGDSDGDGDGDIIFP